MQINVLEISEWNTPATTYEVAQVGTHCLMKHTYKPGWYAYHGMDGYDLFRVRKPFIATKLMEKRTGKESWREWMVDSPTDYRAMQKYAERAKGHVLTTGLGLGLVTHELCKNPKVQSITIVELSQDVIQLVSGYLLKDSRINIVNNDFWNFIEHTGNVQWDTIIVDIWVYWGMEEQVSIYKKEIVPRSQMLKSKYPDSQIFFHGFAGMPMIEQVDKAMENGDDVDSLIYGLRE